MSRISNAPVLLPRGVEATVSEASVAVKGSKGSLSLALHHLVSVERDEENLKVSGKDASRESGAMAGTFRSLINNMVLGVSEGFQKKLELQGVGYRAKASGNIVNLTVGYSHPIDYKLPEGINAETPSQTEIVITGVDKQLVGQVAAEIRDFAPQSLTKVKAFAMLTNESIEKKLRKSRTQ